MDEKQRKESELSFRDIAPDEEMVKRAEAENQRIFSTREVQIGDTLYTVYNCVPKSCTDDQIREQTNKKIERLVMNALDDELKK